MGLGSIIGGIGSIVAAPFTGGTSLAWLPAAIGGGGAVADAIAGHGNRAPSTPTSPTTSNGSPNQGPSGSGKTAEALALIGGMLAGQMLSKRGQQNAVPPELSQLLQMSMARTAAQNPLFDATNRGIYQMLPSFAREGTSMPGTTGTSIPPAAASAPTGDSGGGMDPKLLAILSALGGLGLGGVLTGTNPYGEIIRKLKEAIGGGRDTVQGPNVPNNNAGPGGLPIGNPGAPGFTGWPWENLPGYGTPLPPPAPLPSGPNTGIDWPSLPGYGTPPQ